MIDLHKSVLQILQHGRHRAITGKDIAHSLGFREDRQVRLAIRDLIAEGHPVASAVQPPMGYFLVESLAEAKEYQAGLRSWLIHDALRLRDFKVSAGRYLANVVQGRLM